MAKRPPTKAEKEYMQRVADLGCIVCRKLGYGPTPAQVHHIREGVGMGQRSGHYLIIPLCPLHHQHGGPGVAIHAGETAFEGLYGTEMQLLNQTIEDVFRHG